MIAFCIVVAFVVGTVIACTLMRGAHLNEAPGWPEPILRSTPKPVDYASQRDT